MTRPDVLVVGAGALGAASAYHLARAGRRVVVIDMATPASGATGNSFAWVNAVRKEPDVYHRLNAAGMTEYATLRRELGVDFGYHGGGSLEWADAGERDELRARVSRLAHRGYAAAFVPPKTARALEPGLAIPDDAEVAFYEADGWVDAPRLVVTLLERARSHGAEVMSGMAVRAVRRAGDRIEAVVIDRGDISADTVLFCAGAATEALLAPLGARVPVRRVPGLLAVTSPPSGALDRVVHAPGVHLRPDPSGGILLGASDIDAFATETTPAGAPPEFAKPLLDRACAVFPPLANARLVSARIGIRPMPGDGHTIAGPLPGLANAWVAVTHSAITMGPMLGRLIAAEMTGAPPHEMLAPFRPARFV